MGELQGDSCAVFFQLFAKPVRQTGEAPHGHAERQVLPFYVARANFVGVGTSANWDNLRTDDFGRRWFSNFLLNPFVRRVKRRMDMRSVKFFFSTWLVQILSGSGLPLKFAR